MYSTTPAQLNHYFKFRTAETTDQITSVRSKFERRNEEVFKGKTLIKNFSNALVVLVTTIPALEGHSGMIDYTFLLPVKNDFQDLPARLIRALEESVSLFEAKWSAT